jgi:hypothetical protein
MNLTEKQKGDVMNHELITRVAKTLKAFLGAWFFSQKPILIQGRFGHYYR